MTIASSAPIKSDSLDPSQAHAGQQNEGASGASDGQRLYAEVARRILQARLNDVWESLPLAAARWQEDTEHVHQLRVSVRRSAAALRTFYDVLPPKKTKRFRKSLSGLRQAAGDARDLDVLSLRLRKTPPKRLRKAVRRALTLIEDQRSALQQDFVKAQEELLQDDVVGQSAELIDRVRWRGDGPEPTFDAAMEVRLKEAVDCFATAAACKSTDIEDLHQLRIRAKHLRYTLELGEEIPRKTDRANLVAQLKRFQDRLGKLNDLATSQQWFRRLAKRAKKPKQRRQLRDLTRCDKQKMKSQIRKFHRWWAGEDGKRLREALRQFGYSASDRP